MEGREGIPPTISSQNLKPFQSLSAPLVPLRRKLKLLLYMNSVALEKWRTRHYFKPNCPKAERPKTAIYPRPVYCDYCCKVKNDIQACQQRLNRHLQSGSSSVEEIEELKKNKEDLEHGLDNHRKIAREALQYYRQMKVKCSKQWKKLLNLSQLRNLLKEMKILSSFKVPQESHSWLQDTQFTHPKKDS